MRLDRDLIRVGIQGQGAYIIVVFFAAFIDLQDFNTLYDHPFRVMRSHLHKVLVTTLALIMVNDCL